MKKLIPEYVSGENLRLFTSSSEIPVGQGLCWVAENNKPLLNGNPSVGSAGYLNDPTKYSTLCSALAVPLNGVNGLRSGVMALYRAERDAFKQAVQNLRILLAISPKVASLHIGNRAHPPAARNIDYDRLSDDPTSPNARSLFLSLDNELARSHRTGSSLGVLVCDLDGFKQVNDRFGHLVGNKVLRLIANGLREQCGPPDYAARMGGDEFVLLIPVRQRRGTRAQDRTDAGSCQTRGRFHSRAVRVIDERRGGHLSRRRLGRRTAACRSRSAHVQEQTPAQESRGCHCPRIPAGDYRCIVASTAS